MSIETTDLDDDFLTLLLAENDQSESIPKDANLSKPFALTDIQRGYLLGRDPAMPLGGIACQFYYELACNDLNIDHYLRCWDSVIARHPMMRVAIDAETASQHITAQQSLETVLHDMRGKTTADAMASLDRIRRRLAGALPDPNPASHVLGIEFSLMPDGTCHIHLQFDLIACDQQSILILLCETAALYKNENAALPVISTTFPSYLAKLHKYRADAREPALTYWQSRVDDMPDAPALPYKSAPEEAGNTTFERFSAELEEKQWQALEKLAASNGVTPSTLLLESFGQILRRWTGQDRFAINLTIFDRQKLTPDTAYMVGDFTTNILFDMDLSGSDKIARSNLLLRHQKQLWSDLDHIAVSGVEVAGMLGRRKGQIDGVLMPVVYTATLTDGDAAKVASASDQPGQPVHARSQTPQVALDNQVMVWNGKLRINWDVAVNALPENIAQAMFDAYIADITMLADGPNLLSRPIQHCDPPLIEVKPAPSRIADLWLQSYQKHLDDIAIGTSGETITHGALAALVASIVEGFLARGVTAGSTVAIIMHKSVLQVASALASAVVGATFVPIDARQPATRQSDILASLQPDLILSHRKSDDDGTWTPDPDGRGDATILQSCIGVKPSALAYIIFTSGSTGQPKGVMISHEAACNTINDVSRRFDVKPSDRVLALSELHFDLSIYDIFGVLGQGGAIILPDLDRKQDPSHWSALCERYDVSLWNTVPGLFDLYLDYLETSGKNAPSQLKTIMLSGEWIALDLPNRARAVWSDVQFYSLGGATEAAIWSIWYPVKDICPTWDSIPYGTALAGQSVYVLNAHMEHAPDGVTGDIYISGVGLADGYFADAEKTSAAFVLHPRTGERLYKTGDLGCYDMDGTILFQGRADDQVKINGYRLELGEVQHAIRQHPDVTDCLVMSYARGGGRGLAAFLRGPVSAESVRAHVESCLPTYMLPTEWVLCESFPLTPNGKIDRKALLAHLGKTTTPTTSIQAGELAETVCRLVGDVLKREPASLSDNLVSLGASSLELIALANRIEALTGTRPSLTSLARSIELTDLVELIADLMPTHSSDAPLDLLPGTSALRQWLDHNVVLSDPQDRETFKKSRPHTPSQGAVRLKAAALPPWRCSQRHFGPQAVPFDAMSGLLQGLARNGIDVGGQPYGSAGALFPVRVHLLVPGTGVIGVTPGIYTYDAVAQCLNPQLTELPDDIRTLSIGNSEWIAAASFLLCLTLDLNAIAPLYDKSSLSFGLIEAGAMCQLLETRAPHFGIGLCQIGDLSERQMATILGLRQHEVFLHAIAGGVQEKDPKILDAPDLEEGTL